MRHGPAPTRPSTLPALATDARRRAWSALVAVALLTAVGGACTSDTTTSTGPAATSAPSTATTSTTAAATGTSSTRSTTTKRPTGSNASSTTSDPNVLTPPSIVVHATPGNESYCQKVASALEELAALALAAIGGGSDADALLPDVKRLYQDLADTAPDAIKDDVTVIAQKLQSITSAKDLKKLDDDQDAATAGKHFTDWIKSECGFDPNNPSST